MKLPVTTPGGSAGARRPSCDPRGRRRLDSTTRAEPGIYQIHAARPAGWLGVRDGCRRRPRVGPSSARARRGGGPGTRLAVALRVRPRPAHRPAVRGGPRRPSRDLAIPRPGHPRRPLHGDLADSRMVKNSGIADLGIADTPDRGVEERADDISTRRAAPSRAGRRRAAVIWIAVGAVALCAVVGLSRYELRLVSRRAGLTLLGTRLAGACWCWWRALLEPIAERRYDEKIRGRVVLGVDLSESMATADPVPRGREQLASVRPSRRRPWRAGRSLAGCWKESGSRRSPPTTTSKASGFARDAVDGTPRPWPDALRPRGGSGDPASTRHRLERGAGQGLARVANRARSSASSC